MLNVFNRHRHFAYSLVLLVPVFGMHTPVSKVSLSLIAALVILFVERKRIGIDAELKQILFVFLGYLAVFTVLSSDHSRSLKGSYDIVRGLIQFPVALLLVQYARQACVMTLLKVLTVAIVFAQFFFPQQDFFGFYVNPNNIAVMLVFLVSMSFPSMRAPQQPPVVAVAAALGLAAGLYLLVLTNSRAAWLGCATGAAALILFAPAMSARLRVLLVGAVFCVLLAALFFLNWKGVSLNLRDVLWQELLAEAWKSARWFGYGINYTKELMPTLNLPFQTSHNIFLEIFVSSGLVGLTMLVYLSLRLLWHYRAMQFDRGTLFYTGLFGLCAFVVMDQFDLKFASYRFFGTHCFFLGLIYAHRVLPGGSCSARQTELAT